MAEAMLERVARALCAFDGLPENVSFDGEALWQSYLSEARVVVAVMRDATEAMAAAGSVSFDLDPRDGAKAAALVYADMIDAALTDEGT